MASVLRLAAKGNSVLALLPNASPPSSIHPAWAAVPPVC